MPIICKIKLDSILNGKSQKEICSSCKQKQHQEVFYGPYREWLLWLRLGLAELNALLDLLENALCGKGFATMGNRCHVINIEDSYPTTLLWMFLRKTSIGLKLLAYNPCLPLDVYGLYRYTCKHFGDFFFSSKNFWLNFL
uniref:Uncharacterized protein n=1 Tax=Micrurus lemniscatus lemniscatus TaxID=129467 RepID=A0A2D4ITL8_MICLE